MAFLIRPGWMDNGMVCRGRFLFASVLYLPMTIIIIIIIIIIMRACPPKPVRELDNTVLQNQGVHTDGEITANRSNIIIKNKEEKTCLLIDVAVPADRNVMRKEAENKLKSKSL